MADATPLDHIMDCRQMPDVSRRLAAVIADRAGEIKASWHPLGFVHAELLRSDSVVYRLHLWPAGERRPKFPNWPIHNHVFDLESRVLAGSITNKKYTITSDPSPAHPIYSVEYTSFGSRLRRTGRTVKLNSPDEEQHLAGARYSVPSGEFHASHVADNTRAATLVRTSNHVLTPPLVVGEPWDQGEIYEYHRKPIKLQDFIATLNNIFCYSKAEDRPG